MATTPVPARPKARRLDTVVVSLKTGAEIKGVLREEAENGLVLSSAAIAGNDANGRMMWKPLPGEVVIPAENVDYWQRALPASILAAIE